MPEILKEYFFVAKSGSTMNWGFAEQEDRIGAYGGWTHQPNVGDIEEANAHVEKCLKNRGYKLGDMEYANGGKDQRYSAESIRRFLETGDTGVPSKVYKK